MTSVRDILQNKGGAVWTITPETKVFDALKVMAEQNVGALVILEGESVVGILSERDYARKVILHGKSSREIPVKDIMSRNVHYVRPEQSIQDCMEEIRASLKRLAQETEGLVE